MEWNCFYKRVIEQAPSGFQEGEYKGLATKDYQLITEKRFQYKHCVDVLHQVAKFDPFVDEEARRVAVATTVASVSNPNDDDEEEPSSSTMTNAKARSPAVNSTTNAMGSKLVRPIGTKKAKQLVKLEAASQFTHDKQLDVLERVATANTQIAFNLEKKNQILHLSQLVSVHNTLGNKAKAAEYAAELESLFALKSNEPAASSITVTVPTVPDFVDVPSPPHHDDHDIGNDGDDGVPERMEIEVPELPDGT